MAFVSAPQSPAALALPDQIAGLPFETVAVLGFILLALALLRPGRRIRPRPRPARPAGPKLRLVAPVPIVPVPPGPQPARESQVAQVARARFRLVPLLNRSEARILPMLERIVAEIGLGHRVMAQVSLGEILCAVDAQGLDDFHGEANRLINAKRLDFVIIDARGLTVAAIEYHGTGHHLSDTAFIRDAVKREALRRAGLTLIELPPETDEALLRSLIARNSVLPVLQSPMRQAPTRAGRS